MTIEQINKQGQLRHLITLSTLDRSYIEMIVDRAEQYLTPVGQPPPTDSILKGITVANLFFEASTRTRASFELAAKRLSADVLNLDVNMSSRAKGESIIDTIYTLQAMQIDMFIVRDASTGVPTELARHVLPHVAILNAGESEVSHPTQGLLDLMTIRQRFDDLENVKVAIIGDVKHSRVARSAYEALSKFGVRDIRLTGPEELLPEDGFEETRCYTELSDGIRDADVVMALRIQRERFTEMVAIPDSGEYFKRYGLTEERMKGASPNAIVMHPGPMNRGVEIDGSLAEGPQSVVEQQVTNGMAVRMAVLALAHDHVRASRGSAP
ncbi:MAG: aspartate carbamoyltransferase catalytic subunit [Candidatus Rariloculaceae bacterium]